MNCILNKKDFQKEITTANKFSDKVLGNFSFKLEDGNLTTYTHSSLGLYAFNSATEGTVGKCTVNASRLLQALKSLPEGELKFKTTEKLLKLSVNKASASIPLYTYQEMQTMDIDGTEIYFTDIEVNAIKTAFASTNDNDVRLFSKAVFVNQVSDTQIDFVGTNGKSLSYAPVVTIGYPKFEPFCLPYHVAEWIIANKSEKDMLVITNNTNIKIVSGSKSLVAPLLNIKYPAYQKLLDKDISGINIKLPTKELSDIITRLVTFANIDRDKKVIFTLKENALDVFWGSSDEILEDSINVLYYGETMQFGLHALFLQNALKTFDEEFINISFKAPNCPLKLFGNNPNSYHLIMPMVV